MTTKNSRLNWKSALFGLQMEPFQDPSAFRLLVKGCEDSDHEVGKLYLWLSPGGLFKVSHQRARIIMTNALNDKLSFSLTTVNQLATFTFLVSSFTVLPTVFRSGV